MKFLSILLILFFAITSHAATFTVTRTDDRNSTCLQNDCSLREAVKAANVNVAADTINFNLTLPSIINLTVGELSINSYLTINGLDARNLTISGNNASRVFSISGATITVNINNLTIANGNAATDGGGFLVYPQNTLNLSDVVVKNNTGNSGGGGINQGTLNINRSTFTGNIARPGYGGGGFSNYNLATVTNSTFSNNAGLNGGAIYHGAAYQTAARLRLDSVTISNNNAYQVGGGISIEDPSAYIYNSIIAKNTVSNSAFAAFVDVAGGNINSLGNNLIGSYEGCCTQYFVNGFNHDKVGTPANPIDPKLGALQNNGGQTDTYALQFDSPAVNAGNNANAPATDQRGFARIIGGTIDIGAYESNFLAATPTPTPTVTPTPSPSPSPNPTPSPTPTPTPSPTPAGCTSSINPTSQNFGATGGNGTVSVSGGCNISAFTNDFFIVVNSDGSNGGAVEFSVGRNSGSSRSGRIFIGNLIFTVNQTEGTAKSRTRVKF